MAIHNPVVAYQVIVKSQHGSEQSTQKICAIKLQIIPLQNAALLAKSVITTHSAGQVVVQVIEELNFVESLAMMNLAKLSMKARN